MNSESFILIPENLAITEPKAELLDLINSKEFSDKILFEKESAFHTISVVENEVGRFIHFKDTYQAGFINTPFYSGNLPYINYFLIPYLMNKKIKKVLLIGLGTGKIISDYAKLFDKLDRVDVVDIEENILEIAKDYFGFKEPENFNFYLQDGCAFLRNTRKKYDLIVVDVANNEGIDGRFLEQEYLQSVKKCLSKDGIFVSNLCSSAHLDHKKNKFFKSILNLYKKNFNAVHVYKGDFSDKVYYKSFFDIEERVIDITNVILISSDKEYLSDCSKNTLLENLTAEDENKFNSLGVNIDNYLEDIYSC